MADLNRWANKIVPLEIPVRLTDKVSLFPESSYGGCRVTLILRDGRRISNVTIGWGIEITQVDGTPVTEEAQLGFSLSDIVDAEPYR